MIFGKKFVFLELAKTGSTYARYVLLRLPEAANIGKKHNTYPQLNGGWQSRFNERVKVCSIRNPFEYYVSLFGFACSGRGGLHTRTIIRPDYLSFYHPCQLFYMTWEFLRSRNSWKKSYMDVHSMENFKRFMFLILKDCPVGPGFCYGLSDIHKSIGYFSYDYLRTCTPNFVNDAPDLNNFEDIKKYHRKNNFIDVMLRNERMKDDLLDLGQEICVERSVIQGVIDSKPPRSRTASKHKPYQEYYDQELIALIEEKERLILTEHNYSFDR